MATDDRSAEEVTHYCDDCELQLVVLYDDRPGHASIVCGHCGGTNTRPISEVDDDS
jgi:hypothetical protein